MLRTLLFDNRGAEAVEYVVIGAIILFVMALVVVTLMNRVNTAAAGETTRITNCAPSTGTSGQITGCQ